MNKPVSKEELEVLGLLNDARGYYFSGKCNAHGRRPRPLLCCKSRYSIRPEEWIHNVCEVAFFSERIRQNPKLVETLAQKMHKKLMLYSSEKKYDFVVSLTADSTSLANEMAKIFDCNYGYVPEMRRDEFGIGRKILIAELVQTREATAQIGEFVQRHCVSNQLLQICSVVNIGNDIRFNFKYCAVQCCGLIDFFIKEFRQDDPYVFNDVYPLNVIDPNDGREYLRKKLFENDVPLLSYPDYAVWYHH